MLHFIQGLVGDNVYFNASPRKLTAKLPLYLFLEVCVPAGQLYTNVAKTVIKGA
jgi:hypothetical protein